MVNHIQTTLNYLWVYLWEGESWARVKYLNKNRTDSIIKATLLAFTVKLPIPDLLVTTGPKNEVPTHVIICNSSQNTRALSVREFFGPKLEGPGIRVSLS